MIYAGVCKKSHDGAELGHFNFRAETELTILTICMSKNSDFSSIMIIIYFVFNLMNLYQRIGIIQAWYNLGT